MSEMRGALKHNDETTTGGGIRATGKIPHHGVEVAAEGDEATCPACNSIGTLVNDVYPSFTLPCGRQIAVEGAWIKCRCPIPPRAISSQKTMPIAVNRDGWLAKVPTGFAQALAAAATTGREVMMSSIFDEQFLLKDRQGNPLSNTYYTVRLPSGEIRYGTTDVHGRTERIRTDGAQEIRVYIGHVSNV